MKRSYAKSLKEYKGTVKLDEKKIVQFMKRLKKSRKIVKTEPKITMAQKPHNSARQVKQLVAKAFAPPEKAPVRDYEKLINHFHENSKDISTFKSSFPILAENILGEFEKSKIPGHVLLECLGPDFEKLRNTGRDRDSEKLVKALNKEQYDSVSSFLRLATETRLGDPEGGIDYLAARALRFAWNIYPNAARNVGKNWYKQMLRYKPVMAKLAPERRKLLTAIKLKFRSVPRPNFDRWSGDPAINRWAVELKNIDWWNIHPRYLEMNQDIRSCADSKSQPFVIACFLQAYLLGFYPSANGVEDLSHWMPEVLNKTQRALVLDIGSILSR